MKRFEVVVQVAGQIFRQEVVAPTRLSAIKKVGKVDKLINIFELN